ncbi:MAG: hypothetical protein ACTSQZ_01960 [Candidatus Thorarchaeota archaeon]
MNQSLPQDPTVFHDRDIIQDTEGRIFVVLGYIQPENYVLAFPKYIPDSEGKWATSNQRYKRIFWGGVESVSKGMEVIPQKYLQEDSHFGTTLVGIPTDCIVQHFRPEIRLKELLKEGFDDHLEEFVIEIAESLHETLNIPFENLGVAGSILWKGHNPAFSDINMNIYDFDSSWFLQENYEKVAEEDSHIRVRTALEWSNSISRILERTPVITKEDLQLLFTRRKAFYYDEQCIGITPVLRPPNIPIIHNNETYTSLSDSPTRITMDIENVDYGLFHPGLYEGYSEPLSELDGNIIKRIMVYDGAFTGLLMSGDRVEVSGIIQKVIPKLESDSEPFYQIMVGTKDGAGKEFIRLLS